MTTTPDSTPAETERDEVNDLALVLTGEWARVEGKPVNVSYVATFADMARAALAAGWSRSPRPATEASAALVPPVPGDEPGHGEECGETEPHRQAGAVSGCNGGDQHGDTVEDASAARPATVSEGRLVEVIADTLDRLHVPESADREDVEMDAEQIVRDLLPLLTAQPEAEVRANERQKTLHEWADWIANGEQAAGLPEPFTLRTVIDWMRSGRQPFGVAARTAPAHDSSGEADHV